MVSASIATAMLAGTPGAAAADQPSADLLTDPPSATTTVGRWVPSSARGAEVLVAAELTARGAELANGASGSRVWDCWREAPGEWACAVRLFLVNGAADLRFTVARELTRKRRGGRWVGPWHATGRMAVTSVGPLGTRGVGDS
jgi:hypothetical protein